MLQHLYIAPSKIAEAGFGCYTNVDIPKNSYLGDYSGRLIPANTPLLPREEKIAFMMVSGIRIVPNVNNTLRYINDIINLTASSEYNTRLNYSNLRYNVGWWEDWDSVSVVTIHKIPAHSELYINYGDLYWSNTGNANLFSVQNNLSSVQDKIVDMWKTRVQLYNNVAI